MVSGLRPGFFGAGLAGCSACCADSRKVVWCKYILVWVPKKVFDREDQHLPEPLPSDGEGCGTEEMLLLSSV